jgi:3-oxoacyl-[acyl-carrier-protein] synthase II
MADAVAAMVRADSSMAVYGACAGGLLAIGSGMELIRGGHAAAVVAGGADCLLREFDFFQFCNLYAMSSRDTEPADACCPFDQRRDGFVLSEGAAFLVLESESAARARSAQPLAVLEGYGYSQNAYHMVASPPDAYGPTRAMSQALADAGIEPDAVPYVNAHGTSTRDNDWCETLAIRNVFGSAADDLAVSSSKSELGHLMAAAGAIEAIVTVKALEHQVAPPTINLREPDARCDLDYVVGRQRPLAMRHALTNSFGFGGHNASIVVGCAP